MGFAIRTTTQFILGMGEEVGEWLDSLWNYALRDWLAGDDDGER